MPDDAAASWSDPLLLDEQLDEDERLIRDTTRGLRPGKAHDPGT